MAQWVEVGHKTDDLSSVLGMHITMWKDLEESTLPYVERTKSWKLCSDFHTHAMAYTPNTHI